MSERVKCKKCTNQILPSTANTTGGLCMVCQKISKGKNYISNNPKTNTGLEITHKKAPYFDTSRECFVGLKKEEVKDILFCLQSVVKDGLGDQKLNHILDRYQDMTEGKIKRINLELKHNGVYFYVGLKLYKAKNGPKEIEFNLPNRIIYYMRRKLKKDYFKTCFYSPTIVEKFIGLFKK